MEALKNWEFAKGIQQGWNSAEFDGRSAKLTPLTSSPTTTNVAWTLSSSVNARELGSSYLRRGFYVGARSKVHYDQAKHSPVTWVLAVGLVALNAALQPRLMVLGTVLGAGIRLTTKPESTAAQTVKHAGEFATTVPKKEIPAGLIAFAAGTALIQLLQRTGYINSSFGKLGLWISALGTGIGAGDWLLTDVTNAPPPAEEEG